MSSAPIAAAAADQPPTIIYVHGIGNKPAPAVHKRQWDMALFGIDMGARTRMAYWSDILHPQPAPTGSVLALAAGALDGARTFTNAELVRESKALTPYGPEAQAFAQRLARRMLRGDALRRRMQATEVEGTILPGWVRRWATEFLTRLFIRDVAAYFYDREQREAIQERLRALLLPEHSPYLVLAHSLGSVIAYDVLRALTPPGVQVQLLLTFGSPLGIEEVQDHVAQPLQIAEQVAAWRNVADRLDPVALDPTLSEEFAPTGTIRDEVVVNPDSLRLRGFDPHSWSGYLSTAAIKGAVRDVLGPAFGEPVSPFVIARDVAADMANPAERLPVLIELTEEMVGATLDDKRAGLVAELRRLTRRTTAARIDPLRRYVAADLTPEEIDRMSARHRELAVARVWKNSVKRALLDVSTNVVQAHSAHVAYGALGRGVVWAVLDTGVRADHPHFAGHANILRQWDCTGIGAPAQGNAADGHGHGTHVAGIIAGEGPGDYARLRGMAPEAGLHIYKVLDDAGRGNDSWIIKALDHIAAVNESAPNLVIHGINLSLGGRFDPTVYGTGHSPICQELRRLWRQGVVVCIAAGNEGRLVFDTQQGEEELYLDLSIGDPANLEDAIAVGSVHKSQPHMYGISYFSSRGPTADGRAKPDVVAPGEKVVSCNARFVQGKPESLYVAMSGTSMACPHVSGVIAAFLSVRREFIGHPDRVKQILLANATDLGRDRYHQGAGVPNAVRMLTGT